MRKSEWEDAYGDDQRRLRGAILTEPILSLKPRAPILVTPETSVAAAIEFMNEGHRGCVCIVEKDRLVGIFTERDLLRVVRFGEDLGKIQVQRVMTVNPDALRPDHGIALALNMMSEGGFRHIPLVDSDRRPVGIVAMRDIVRFIVSMFPDAILTVPPNPTVIPTKYGG